MTTVVVGCDINSGDDSAALTTTVNALQKAGYTTEQLSIGPGPFGNYDWYGASSGKIGVYLMAPSIVSIADAMSHQGFDKVVFGLRGDLGLRGTTEFDTAPWRPDPDCSAVCEKYSGKTGRQIKEMIEPRGTIVIGNTPEELANNVVSAVGGGSGGTGSTGSGGQGASNVSPLLSGEMTFEELVGEICNGIDLMFLCKRSTVVVTDFETIFAEAKYLRDNYKTSVKSEQVNLWQMEEDSYELNVNQHGFYNTVIVKYQNGEVKETFDDLVRVYGEVPITYEDKKVDKSTAVMKAKAYLAAHLRDLEMTVNTTMLADADIDIGDIITIENPKTFVNKNKIAKKLDPEFLFTKGVNTSWEGDSYISADIECQFSPTSPKRLDVPTAGTATGGTSSGGGVSGNIDSCGVTSDKKYVVSIASPSAGRSESYSYGKTYVTVFDNKCPRCGAAELKWDSGSSGGKCITCGGYSGSKSSWGDISESEVSCNSCCSDFCGVTGWEKDGNFSSRLSIHQSPTEASSADKSKLSSGTYSL